MRPFRTLLFWCHLTAGVLAGVVILIMSVTGVLLTYERQMVLWADTRGLDTTPPTPGATRLPIEALLAQAREARPGVQPQSIAVRRDPAAPVSVALGRDGFFYLHPYTGAVLGSGSAGVRAFFRSVTNWHRWLALSGDRRTTGRAITGAANLLFLFIVCSGIYLWLPRVWTWIQVKQVLWFRRGLPGKARDFNWHNVAGFWSAIPLAIVVASGVVISYPWASNLVYRLAGEAPPVPARAPGGAGGPGGPGSPSNAGRPEGGTGGLDLLWCRAEAHVEGWQIITLRLPAAESGAVFTIDRGDGGQPQKRATLTLDRESGDVVRYETFSANSAGRRARMLLRFAHTGEVLGLAGQTVAGLVSAGGAVLVYTGLALSWRRFLAWCRRRRPADSAVARDVRVVEVPLDGAPGTARRAEAID